MEWAVTHNSRLGLVGRLWLWPDQCVVHNAVCLIVLYQLKIDASVPHSKDTSCLYWRLSGSFMVQDGQAQTVDERVIIDTICLETIVAAPTIGISPSICARRWEGGWPTEKNWKPTVSACSREWQRKAETCLAEIQFVSSSHKLRLSLLETAWPLLGRPRWAFDVSGTPKVVCTPIGVKRRASAVRPFGRALPAPSMSGNGHSWPW